MSPLLEIGFPERVLRLGCVVFRSRTLKLAMKLYVQLAAITTCYVERLSLHLSALLD